MMWVLLAFGWHKMDSDGARRVDDGRVVCGGTIRDSFSTWCLSFVKFIDVIVEVDSMEVIWLIQSDSCVAYFEVV
ncbi:hypothetical protein V6N11_079442 [Hibiscus sabdariffa]|uniref:RNase H type-1 domain-containing protein n=1 Tax=Hibiscus sabdariffa TaxID=183260 RepID=A0ABR2RVE0_9ROSI